MDVISNIIKHFVGSGMFTIEDVNKKIDEFEYAGFETRDKPQYIWKLG